MGSADHTPVAQRAGAPASAPPPVTLPRGAYAGVSVVALLLGAAAIVRGTRGVVTAHDSDITTFFLPAADKILHGHPWAIYTVRAFGGYPNYNPPISIFLMAPLLALARALGLGANLGGLITVVAIPFMVFVLLLGYVTIVALRSLFPSIPETQRFLAYVLIVFSPLTWQAFTIWYHVEQPLMLALLVGAIVAFQARREGLAGLLAGLAVLTRTTALIPLVAFGALLLFGREWRGLLRFGGVAALVAGLGFAPFFRFDRADALYSLVTWRGGAPIGGNAIWSLVRYDGTAHASPVRYSLDHLARRLDMYTVILFVALVALLAVRRLRISAYGREAWAVLAIAALAVPMLSKTIWPYYFLEPFVFLLIWEFASMHDRRSGVWRWPILTFGFLSVAATLSQFIGLQSVGTGDLIVVGLIEFSAMLAFALAVWYRARAGRIEPVLAGAGATALRGEHGKSPARGGRGGAASAARGQPGPSGQAGMEGTSPAYGAAPPVGAAGAPGPSAQQTPWPGLPGSAPPPGWQSGPVRPPEGWRPASFSPSASPQPGPAWPEGQIAPHTSPLDPWSSGPLPPQSPPAPPRPSGRDGR
jgi:Glycosyltransferase family 87